MSFSVTITFELQYKSAFEATSLLAGFLAVAVFVVIYGCSSLSKALDFKAFDPFYDRKPTQEENREENKKVPIVTIRFRPKTGGLTESSRTEQQQLGEITL